MPRENLCGDCNGWYESGAVGDLVIRRNRFVNALTSLYQFTEGVISIYPVIPSPRTAAGYFHGGRPGAISITDNEFDQFESTLLYAKSVDGLLFRDNVIRRNADFAPLRPGCRPVVLEHTRRAVVVGEGLHVPPPTPNRPLSR